MSTNNGFFGLYKFYLTVSFLAFMLIACDGGGSESSGPAIQNGTGPAAVFNGPLGLTTDSLGNVYVADYNNLAIRKITPAGVVTTFASSLPGFTIDIEIDNTGSFYVTSARTNGGAINKVSPTGVVGTSIGSANGTGTTGAQGIAINDNTGDIYVASFSYSILKITPADVVTTLAGATGSRGNTNGTGTNARFDSPDGLATDSAGNVYVADPFTNSIRKVTPAGVVSTFAGSQVIGSDDGSSGAAKFQFPTDVATDSADNVYVADTGNNTIRMITPGGTVSTIAGTAGQSGSTDGFATDARFNSPGGITIDNAGNIYVSDTGNNTIRMITPAGMVSTLAGTPN